MRMARALLRVAILGCVAAVANTGLTHGGAIFSVLWMEWGMPEDVALWIVRVGSWIVLAASIAIWFPPARTALWWIAAWLLLVAFARVSQTERHPWIIPGAMATRILAPIALLALVPPRIRVERATWILRVAAALTFACHGYEALRFEPAFFDYIVIASRRFTGSEFEPDTIYALLVAIGVVDIVVAAWILWKPTRSIALYMAVWGLITALSRTVHSGWVAKWEVALRLPNVAVPLALFFLLCTRQRAITGQSATDTSAVPT